MVASPLVNILSATLQKGIKGINQPHEDLPPGPRHHLPSQALERRQRIILDMQLDAELLPEERWPHRMPRGRVRPSPAALALGEAPDVHATETRASILRKTHVRIARKHGHHDMREER